MTSILIQGGRVIDPASGIDETADVLIENDLVAEIGRISPPTNAQVIDAEGCLVSPGLLDIHVHFREPDPRHRETITTGSAAAINGGFTTVCCMPNTRPALDNANLIKEIHHKAREANGARVFVVGCVSKDRKGKLLADLESMTKSGAVAFSDDGSVVADEELMRQALQKAKSLDSCIMQHCQEPSMTVGAVMNAGVLAAKLGLIGWPREAEEVIIDRDIKLNTAIGCRYHAQHVSSGGSVDFIRKARTVGQPVTGEASPHHLLLTEEACDGYDTNAKMNPPLRAQHDIDQLKIGIADGTITVLATDHAPHPPHTKETDFESASFGIVGVDCALPLYVKALIEDGVIDWPAMLAMMTIQPAELVGLDRQGLGKLSTGGPADITIIDPDLKWTIDSSDFASTGRNCPFNGWKVRGRAVATIVNGQVKSNRLSARVRV